MADPITYLDGLYSGGTVALDGTNFGPALTVGPEGRIAPTAPGAIGVYASGTLGASLTNNGHIQGAAPVGHGNPRYGAGVYLYGAPLQNTGEIYGGSATQGDSNGGIGALLSQPAPTDAVDVNYNTGFIIGGAGYLAGAGGAGLAITHGRSFTNDQFIAGGTGGVANGTGGVGINFSSGYAETLTADDAKVFQYGYVMGGAGGTGAAGGAGVNLSILGDYLRNESNVGPFGIGRITGGYGGAGADGGTGVSLFGAAPGPGEPGVDAVVNDDLGVILGGGGGASDSAGVGGAGGAGVAMAGGYAWLEDAQGRVYGGAGGFGSLQGGAGGTGISLSDHALFVNTGNVSGGAGGAGPNPGVGGTGVYVTASTTVDNARGSYVSRYGGQFYPIVGGEFDGGRGGSVLPGSQGSGAAGGAGAIVAGGTLTNSQSLYGGVGGSGSGGAYANGTGGAGALVESGTLTNTGSILGGRAGDALSPATKYESGSQLAAIGTGGDGVDLIVGAGAVVINTIQGTIRGGSGSFVQGIGTAGNGGDGVRLIGSGGEFSNQGSIYGGFGYVAGQGVSLTDGTLFNGNSGTIRGGFATTGGIAGADGVGGAGVLLSGGGSIENAGYIHGGGTYGGIGNGGAGIEVAAGASGPVTVFSYRAIGGFGRAGGIAGAGIDMQSAGNVTVGRTAQGGMSAYGSNGGTGVNMAAGGLLINAPGAIIGGGTPQTGSGDGGTGAVQVGGALVNKYQSTILGGDSGARNGTGATGHGGDGLDASAGASITDLGSVEGGFGASGGGAGVRLSGASFTTATSYGGNRYQHVAVVIIGGDSINAAGGTALIATDSTVTLAQNNGPPVLGGETYYGQGGTGVALYDGSTLTSDIDISGGTVFRAAGSAGTALVISGGSVATNQADGNLFGGGGAGATASQAGVGVYLNDGTFIDYGGVDGGSYANQFTPVDAVKFGASGQNSVYLKGNWSINGAIAGFSTNDRIDIAGVTINATNQANYLQTSGSSATLESFGPGTAITQTLQFTGLLSDDFMFNADGSGGTIVTVACYLRGTRILTAHGEVAIEHLKIGDHVITHTGEALPIRWIGQRRYRGVSTLGRREVQPVRIERGALAPDVPSRDLWVSPEHALFIDGLLVPAAALVNGASICQETHVSEIEYFHLEFDTHAVIYAEGAAAESFVDDDSRQLFDNAADYVQRYPQARAREVVFCAPRVEEGAQLEQVRARLAAGYGAGLTARRPSTAAFIR